jgi:hypothetical protein
MKAIEKTDRKRSTAVDQNTAEPIRSKVELHVSWKLLVIVTVGADVKT